MKKTLFCIVSICSIFFGLTNQTRYNIEPVLAEYKMQYSTYLKYMAENKRVAALEAARSSLLASIPSKEERAVIAKYPHAALISHIYKSESTYGRNDVCRNRGGANGFGFGEWPGHRPTCYSSFEEVVSLVNTWIDNYKHKGEAWMSCYYIRGIASEKCNSDYKFVTASL